MAEAASDDRLIRRLLVVWIAVFAGFALANVLRLPVTDLFDELQHWSFAVALRAHPTPFPDYGAYRILAPDLTTWTTEPNYLAHPPLYHLLIAPLTALGPLGPTVVRVLDVALVMAGLALAVLGLVHRTATRLGRVVVVVLVFALSETTRVAALVNNDAALTFETGLLVFAVAGPRPRPALAAVVLAAIGWTKFNGFVGCAVFLAALHFFAVLDGRARLLGPDGRRLLAGFAVGAVPTVANLIALGRPVWAPDRFPDWFQRIAPEIRVEVDVWRYGAWFAREIGARFPFADHVVDALPFLGLLAVLAFVGVRPGPVARPEDRALARAGLIAATVFAALLWLYGWRGFATTGILSEAQPRYFLAVWPGFVFAVVHGLDRLSPRLADPLRVVVLAAGVVLSTPLVGLFALIPRL